jgi:hypothetical protein
MRHYKRCDNRLAIRQGATRVAVDFFEDGTNNCPAEPLFERAVGWHFIVDGKKFVDDELDGCPTGTLYFQLEGTEEDEDEDDFDVLSEGSSVIFTDDDGEEFLATVIQNEGETLRLQFEDEDEGWEAASACRLA